MAGERKVVRNLRAWAVQRRVAIVALAQDWAGTLEAQMKSEQAQAKYWKNRTHAALGGLRGEVIVGRTQVTIALAHSVDYGVYLELANDGKHAILKPTLDAAIPDIYRAYKRLWE